MNPRASDLIRALGLEPHPEGGYFREVFRSQRNVKPLDERSERSALTSIYFLLVKGQCSRWHRVRSDEAWHFQEGDPLVVVWIDADNGVHEELLATGSPGGRSLCVVPAGCWQAAKPLGEFSLMGCTVGPGFDFQDFEMLSPDSEAVAPITALNPDFREFL